MNVDCVIGIDPGKQGGIAIYTKEDGMVRTVRMPADTEDLAELMRYYVENFHPVAFLEKLNLHKDDARVPGKIFGIEKLIGNFNQLRVTMEVVGVPFCMVHPISWEYRLGLREKGRRESKTERKRRYQSVAARMYPGNKVTLWNADALLIMTFGRAVLANDLAWVRSNLPAKCHDTIFGANGAI